MHMVLYRKKRPTRFQDIIGQEPIVTTLRNQLKSGNTSHAYLFCGTRGTGKTTTAKVFARAVNCEGAGELAPCNTCNTCQDILAERNLNVMEIDAASNNGVDNIRDLREEVMYPPSSGRYKVYIIDEAHMLTGAAFNALLKTLEEPPPHVIFILATTDVQKLPVTILSRCQRYDFKRINRKDMLDTMRAYMDADGIKVEDAALEYITAVSDGAMRDALSILEQCISLYAGESLTLRHVQDLLGAVDRTVLFEFADALLQEDANAALGVIADASRAGRDLGRFASDVITHFRNLMLASQLSGGADILDCSGEMLERYKQQAAVAGGVEGIIEVIYTLSDLQNQMRYLPQERLALEVCVIKLCTRSNTPPANAAQLSKKVDKPAAVTIANATPEPTVAAVTASAAPQPPAIPEPAATPRPEASISTSSDNIADNWLNFCKGLSMLLKPMLSSCTVEANGSNISLTCKNAASQQYIQENKTNIITEITNFFKLQEAPSLFVTVSDAINNTTATPNTATTTSKADDSFRSSLQSQINMPVTFE